MAPNDTIAYFQQNILGHMVRVDILDGRIFYGEVECIDNQRNLILKDAIEEIPDQYLSSLNGKLEVFIANSYTGEPFVSTAKIPEEKLENFGEKFTKNKFKVGGVVIMAKDLKRLLVQKK